MATPVFDVDAFLAEPITARVATNGPTVRPLWYQWEGGHFWMMSGPWARLFKRVQTDPQIALVIDVCEFHTGRILQIIASGEVAIVPFDIPRGRRLLHRYLGPDEESWPSEPDNYRAYLAVPGPPGISWLKLKPRKLLPFNFSYKNRPLVNADHPPGQVGLSHS